MIWRRPRWAARLQPDPVGALLSEAHMVGVVGRGAITTPTRTLLAGAAGEDVVKAMDKVLPRPIDHFLLQADLTVVVPGPLERDLPEQLGAVARVESAGAAMVYRISGGVDPAGPRYRPDRCGAAHLLLATLQPLCHKDSPT